jgi:hypothetical protein
MASLETCYMLESFEPFSDAELEALRQACGQEIELQIIAGSRRYLKSEEIQ